MTEAKSRAEAMGASPAAARSACRRQSLRRPFIGARILTPGGAAFGPLAPSEQQRELEPQPPSCPGAAAALGAAAGAGAAAASAAGGAGSSTGAGSGCTSGWLTVCRGNSSARTDFNSKIG